MRKGCSVARTYLDLVELVGVLASLRLVQSCVPNRAIIVDVYLVASQIAILVYRNRDLFGFRILAIPDLGVFGNLGLLRLRSILSWSR